MVSLALAFRISFFTDPEQGRGCGFDERGEHDALTGVGCLAWFYASVIGCMSKAKGSKETRKFLNYPQSFVFKNFFAANFTENEICSTCHVSTFGQHP
jgi:hypothetical protein